MLEPEPDVFSADLLDMCQTSKFSVLGGAQAEETSQQYMHSLSFTVCVIKREKERNNRLASLHTLGRCSYFDAIITSVMSVMII